MSVRLEIESPFDLSELERLRDVATIAAQKAGAFIREKWSEPRSITRKADDSLVTEIDRGAERIIREVLATHTPDLPILGEEGGWSGDRELDAKWYVDPVDGTTNLAHGFPWCAVSIALVAGNTPCVGVVYNPLANHLFSAALGRGATLNGTPIHVTAEAELKKSLLATGFGVGSVGTEFDNSKLVNFMLQECYAIRRVGSAALDLACVAAGWFDGYWEFGLNPWDTAAGWLLVLEAGGRVTAGDGGPFDPRVKSLVATNGHAHSAVLDALARYEETVSSD